MHKAISVRDGVVAGKRGWSWYFTYHGNRMVALFVVMKDRGPEWVRWIQRDVSKRRISYDLGFKDDEQILKLVSRRKGGHFTTYGAELTDVKTCRQLLGEGGKQFVACNFERHNNTSTLHSTMGIVLSFEKVQVMLKLSLPFVVNYAVFKHTTKWQLKSMRRSAM